MKRLIGGQRDEEKICCKSKAIWAEEADCEEGKYREMESGGRR